MNERVTNEQGEVLVRRRIKKRRRKAKKLSVILAEQARFTVLSLVVGFAAVAVVFFATLNIRQSQRMFDEVVMHTLFGKCVYPHQGGRFEPPL